MKIYENMSSATPQELWDNAVPCGPAGPCAYQKEFLDFRVAFTHANIGNPIELSNVDGTEDADLTYEQKEGFSNTSTQELTITASASFEFAGAGGGVEISGTMGFEQQSYKETTTTISIKVRPGHTTYIYQGKCQAFIMQRYNKANASPSNSGLNWTAWGDYDTNMTQIKTVAVAKV
jgi:hypothetical protein